MNDRTILWGVLGCARIACRAADAREMAEACREHGVLLMEAFAHRFDPQYRQVTEWIRRGRIGRILRVSAAMSRSDYPAENIRMSRSLGGGAQMDLGCCCTNTARYLIGSELVSAFAHQDIGSRQEEAVRSVQLWRDTMSMQILAGYSPDLCCCLEWHHLPYLKEHREEYAFRGNRMRVSLQMPSACLLDFPSPIVVTGSDGETA